MTEKLQLVVSNRRHFILGATAAATLLSLPKLGFAEDNGWKAAMEGLVGSSEADANRVSIELPEIAENGNTVPFSVAVESPMTDEDHVKAVHVFATGNPRPDIGSFMFTPANGVADASSRMRLGRTQDIVAVAEMSNGQVFMATQTVKGTIGGCGG